ncbi:MAG: CPBP family glutamic-type intramembrane protease [Desulfobacterales bacterium]|nr:CPBP family glutamic-type intramembrane protease [Desulfobacterales bacterium]
MSADRFRPWPLAATVLLAAVLWFVTFALPWASFWVKISLSASLLAGISLLLQPLRREEVRVDPRAVLIGLASAALLYFVFWAGRAASMSLFDFAGRQIGGIYHKGEGTPLWAIALLLFCVTGPSEEIFWRGYLQRSLMGRFGRWPGWALATAVYAGVHVWSLNFMLIGAAAVAGAFWGAMYAHLGRLSPVILSHAVWSTVIFAVFPMR